jgi:hypothetical protein
MYRSDLGIELQVFSMSGSLYVGVNFKTCDWSTRISLVILLVLSLVRISLGTPNLYCGSAGDVWCIEGSIVHVYTNWYTTQVRLI